MQVTVTREADLPKVENLFILLAESDGKRKLELEGELRRTVEQAIADSGFSGRADEGITILTAIKGIRKITLIGLGKEKGLNHRVTRAAVYGVGRISRRNRDREIAVYFSYELARLGSEGTTRWLTDQLIHADYRFGSYLTKEENKPLPISCALIARRGADKKTTRRVSEEAAIIAEAVRTVRDLGNAPGNEVTPTRLAARAREVAAEVGVKCTVYDKQQITRMKMGGLLAVSRGSDEEPRFVVLDYSPKKAKKTIVLVGKGITFDSGGISIKPADKMEEMKFDMCGAAAVIGTIQAAARLELPHRIVGLIVSTENLSGGSAYKPGDIITMMSGKTVEVVNTDAEGRMILADALHYASDYKPDHLIDLATLTGACVVALGNECSGLFTSDDDLAQKLIESGERSGERLWRLPEWDDYKELIKSEWADMKNSGGRWGGAISAALFLKEFVDCPSWAHLDIAGTAWTEGETPREGKGATGVGVRLLIDFLESLS